MFQIKKLLKITVLYFLCFQIGQAYSEILTQRKCVLLPIVDELDNSIGFKVYENIEKYLREATWCYYRSNSEVLSILNNYRKNLPDHLKNPDVLAIIADKTKAGSLIKISIKPGQASNSVQILIIGQNGSDVYLNEGILLKELDTEIISQTIINWLNEFQKTIPYDGLVSAILSDQISIDAGSDNGLVQNTQFKIIRPLRKKSHPLLKEIVDWETEILGRGEIFYSNNMQSQGKIKELVKQGPIQIGDWIVRVKSEANETITKKDESVESYGKIGEASVGVSLNSFSTSLTNSNTQPNKLSGPGVGVQAGVETWITRVFWTSLYLDKSIGSMKKKEGNFQNSSYTAGPTTFKFKVGYKYLPLGFFYGPQLDVALGYGSYGFTHDNSSTDGMTSFSYKGLLFSVKGTIPYKNIYKFGIGLDALISPKYSEEINLYGASESTSSYDIYFFGRYNYAPTMTIDSEINFHTSTANFSSNREVSNKKTSLKIGTTFSF